MYRQWTLSDLEFVVLWEEQREVLLPTPFTYRSNMGSYAEGERQQQRTRAHLRAVDNYGLGDALEIIARPDLQIILHAWDPRYPEDPHAHIRLHIARRSDRTFLLEQLPGATLQHSGGFIITECGYLAVAGSIVDRLPRQSAGRLTDVVLPGGRESEGHGQSLVREPHEDPSRAAAAEFSTAPRNLVGAIEVRQGVAPLGPKYRASQGFWVFDLAGDGRYVVWPERTRVATGVDSVQLVEAINSAVARIIVAIKDQRARA
ncbi:hypothetical protein HGA13_01605 [Nocardia speluncae]|uniref:ESAT-6 protein secretion system EspG family protein n=1 Tax=Nocardia speluncae TaxID=419477 RepID=A0A846XAU7_9NOCA|nr:ESX secretion-associated protein EspG [Nocardia speluncae]NKY31773.1 hypothetical protein [Nocardia speluncae]